jgi:demethylmenaquinone methyltransferase/2-methoxy-6-polyprenyl-1,4-benzoquinol methylase
MTDAVDKSGRAVKEMFAGVAPRYDLLNRLLSATLDVLWRRRAAAVLAPAPGSEVLDLCCGTGDQSKPLLRRRARVVAADFCLPMLALAQRKLGPAADGGPRLAAADALALPFPSGRFAGAVVSFGLRNVADLDQALGQIGQALAAGGKLVVLEFALPRQRLLRAVYLFYFRRLLPWIGRLLSPRGSAYSYLPASVSEFPQRDEFLEHMATAGFDELAYEELAAGVVCLYQGRWRG